MDLINDLGVAFQYIIIALPILLYLRDVTAKRGASKKTSLLLDSMIIPLLVLFALNIYLIFVE